MIRFPFFRFETCYQIALAIKDEVEDLEKNGITVIQIDEAALREGLPLRKSEQAFYLDWAVHSFRITNCGVQDTTQVCFPLHLEFHNSNSSWCLFFFCVLFMQWTHSFIYCRSTLTCATPTSMTLSTQSSTWMLM